MWLGTHLRLQLSTVKPLKCTVDGCNNLVHHLCQNECEQKIVFPETLSLKCCLHHPQSPLRASKLPPVMILKKSFTCLLLRIPRFQWPILLDSPRRTTPPLPRHSFASAASWSPSLFTLFSLTLTYRGMALPERNQIVYSVILLERPHPQSAGTTKSQRRVGTRKCPKKKTITSDHEITCVLERN